MSRLLMNYYELKLYNKLFLNFSSFQGYFEELVEVLLGIYLVLIYTVLSFPPSNLSAEDESYAGHTYLRN